MILFEASGAVFLKVDVSSASFLAQEDRVTLPLAKKGLGVVCRFSKEACGQGRGVCYSYGCGIAGIAQLVEQLICNQQVVGSSPTAGSLSQRDLGKL